MATSKSHVSLALSFPNSRSVTLHSLRVSLPKVPSAVRNFFQSGGSGGDRVVLSGLHVDSSSDLARETAYKLYYQHDERQEELLTALLGRRALLAR